MAQNITNKSINKEIEFVLDCFHLTKQLSSSKMFELISVEDQNLEGQEEKNPLSQVLQAQILTRVVRVQGLVNDFDVAHGSLGEAAEIVKTIMSLLQVITW